MVKLHQMFTCMDSKGYKPQDLMEMIGHYIYRRVCLPILELEHSKHVQFGDD